ncbi:hypothetical protein QWZ04_21325 [Vibrio tapetis subsp. quintayensis]|uniref:LON peptidase substrate-binding domain-containing protein n=1 Tax=Vibrio tapetis TaxID=52443 RepID=UPI0025B308E8|nr:LON peptidase substrate-binding domain-containing protein [Vibrio tapetis]MDN3682850.1 hypothetical protein [Vibrio tapetis subsp. quintayensis]
MTDYKNGIQVKRIDLPTSAVLPVFPLPIFILSGGMQRLRIFEPRYVSMIANTNQTNGFVIAHYDQDKDYLSSDWGAHVQIVDFDQGSDGVLTVDVLATRMVSLSHFSLQADNLLVAQTQTLPHWSMAQHGVQVHETRFASVLKDIFSANYELSTLYPTQHFDYAEWVGARLLEILPLPIDDKHQFIHQLDYAQLVALLNSLIDKHN